jgi:hypothetical protein
MKYIKNEKMILNVSGIEFVSKMGTERLEIYYESGDRAIAVFENTKDRDEMFDEIWTSL